MNTAWEIIFYLPYGENLEKGNLRVSYKALIHIINSKFVWVILLRVEILRSLMHPSYLIDLLSSDFIS